MGRLSGLMMFKTLLIALVALVLLSAAATPARAEEKEAGATGGKTTLIADGKSRFAIYAPEEVMAETEKEGNANYGATYNNVKANRARLRESVKDLAATLERVSGAKVEILTGAPKPGDERKPILIGSLAEAKFGKPAKPYDFKQGFRYVVTPSAIGLLGESDLATSYAIYELVWRLGCRMYMPGELGWCVPTMETVKLANADYSGHPHTVGRQIWFADANYGRRNRLGGLYLAAGHAFEMYISEEDRKKHPEWNATIDGVVQPHRLRWTAPGVKEAIADEILAQSKKYPEYLTFSLSPNDGLGYDNSKEDRAMDAGDFDESMQDISLSDRLIWACNQIAQRVNAQRPDLIFGMLAYVPYSRPPVREKVDPHIVPEIAPITFSRAHPMDDDGEPNNKALRYIVEGWAKAAPRTAYYFYSWFLAELSGPNPMIRKWGNDIPFIYQKGNCYFWQPETIANFDTCFHAYTLGYSLAWDPTRDPKQIIDELHQKFYGNAAKEMAEYWHFIDEVWYGTPEYSGCGFGHMRRWNPENMRKARMLMNKGKAAAKTQMEKDRIKLADEGLVLFEDFMRMRHDLANGNWANLAADGDKYIATMKAKGDEYAENFTFGKVGWSTLGSVNNAYFASFYHLTYKDASRLAASTRIVLDKPLRKFKFMADPKKVGDQDKWYEVGFNDKGWRETDPCVNTWSSMDMHNYMGQGWYRTTVKVNAVQTDRKMMVWLGATDGAAEVWVNGKPAKYVDPKGKKKAFNSYCEPASFDATGLVVPGNNQITIKTTRTDINELGTGGLIAPVTLYQVP